MSNYQSEVKVYVAGNTVSKPVMAWVSDNKRSITSFKVKVDTLTSAMNYELVVWGDKAHNEPGEMMLEIMTQEKLRVIAIGEPTDQVYAGRVQHRVTCRELWVEDLKAGTFVPVLLPKKVETVEREYSPIEMPATVL